MLLWNFYLMTVNKKNSWLPQLLHCKQGLASAISYLVFFIVSKSLFISGATDQEEYYTATQSSVQIFLCGGFMFFHHAHLLSSCHTWWRSHLSIIKPSGLPPPLAVFSLHKVCTSTEFSHPTSTFITKLCPFMLMWQYPCHSCDIWEVSQVQLSKTTTVTSAWNVIHLCQALPIFFCKRDIPVKVAALF